MKRVTRAICEGCADDGRCSEITHEDFVMIAFFKGQETGRSVVSLEDALGPDRAGSVDLGNHGTGGVLEQRFVLICASSSSTGRMLVPKA